MSETIKRVDKNTVEIMLLMTEKCNLSCRYCYEINKTDKRMSFDVARRIIDNEIRNIISLNENIVIQFFGGEPLLEFETIKQIYAYIKQLNLPNFNYCFTVTNGTLLNAEMKNWMYEYRQDFICGLSLDGTKAIHDFNRSNSYDLIDFDFFLKTWPTQKIKMTISPDMLSKLSEGVIHCHKLGFGVLCNLADGLDWAEESTDILKEQLYQLVKYYLDNPDKDVCSILKMPLLHVALKNKTSFPKWCGAGDHIHAYDTEGKVFPCQLFMGVSGVGTQIPKIEKIYSSTVLPDKCKKCAIFGGCPTCIGTNAIRKRDLFYHTDVECKNIKIQFLATSYLMYEKYKRSLLKMSKDEEYTLLNSIYEIQKDFSDL